MSITETDRLARQRESMRKRRAAEREASEPTVRECRHCGAPFETFQLNRFYCSPEHREAAERARRRETEYQPPERICRECGGLIPRKSGRRTYCGDDCAKAAAKARWNRWSLKNVDPESLDYHCVICGTTEDLRIDHDHRCCDKGDRSCGKCVRGLACHKHNVAMGMFDDDPELLERAAAHIRHHRERLAQTSGS